MTWQYIAGFFDGEGCVLFPKENQVRISIAQKPREVLDLISSFLKEHDIKAIVLQTRKGDKEIHQIRINRKMEVLSFLKNITPFTVVKRKKIEKGISILNKLSKYRTHWSEYEISQMIQMRRDGLKVRKIAEILRRPFRTVAFYCYERNTKNG